MFAGPPAECTCKHHDSFVFSYFSLFSGTTRGTVNDVCFFPFVVVDVTLCTIFDCRTRELNMIVNFSGICFLVLLDKVFVCYFWVL